MKTSSKNEEEMKTTLDFKRKTKQHKASGKTDGRSSDWRQMVFCKNQNHQEMVLMQLDTKDGSVSFNIYMTVQSKYNGVYKSTQAII